jgi:hypothetical protein
MVAARSSKRRYKCIETPEERHLNNAFPDTLKTDKKQQHVDVSDAWNVSSTLVHV